MARPKTKGDTKALNIRIDSQISDELTRISDDTGFSKTRIVEKALKDYFDSKQKILDALK